MKPPITVAKSSALEPSVASAETSLPTSAAHRRARRRVPHRVPCRVRLLEPRTGAVQTVIGETVNLSEGGVALQIGVEVPVGTWVETLVPHANGDPLFLCGTVVHVRRTLISNYEIGIAVSEDAPPWIS